MSSEHADYDGAHWSIILPGKLAVTPLDPPGPEPLTFLSSKGPSRVRESAAGPPSGLRQLSEKPPTTQLNGPPLLRSPHLGDPEVQKLFSNAYLMTT